MKSHSCSLLLLIIFLFVQNASAQIQTEWIDSAHRVHDFAYFFTNRPQVIEDDGSHTFENKFTGQTNNLYFCLFDYDQDSIYIRYRAENTADKYPTKEVDQNILYKVYEELHEKKGIRQFYIIIPGYSKTFEKQVYDYIYRLKKYYADSIRDYSAAITYAWGNEWRAPRYYSAKRSAKNGANDFAIFQHMLEDFLTDSAYFNHEERDFKIDLLCSSMGNQLLKKYLLQREKQDIDLVKIYNEIVFLGSDASWDSFEEGKGFHNIDQLTDSVVVFINKTDAPLRFSQVLNPKTRMGLSGPKHMLELPGFIRIRDITHDIMLSDLPGLGHDYLLSNPYIRNTFLADIRVEQEVLEMKE